MRFTATNTFHFTIYVLLSLFHHFFTYTLENHKPTKQPCFKIEHCALILDISLQLCKIRKVSKI